MDKLKEYKRILREVEELQRDLMAVENYDEDAYQALETTIDTLTDLVTD